MVGREVVLRREHAAFGVLDESSRPHRSGAGDTDDAAGAAHHRRLGDRRATGGCCSIGLNLEVHAGEIVGVAGVEGNGQRTLGDVLVEPVPARRRPRRGRRSARSTTGQAGAMARAGIAVIPEDRHDSGCVLDFNVAENMFIADPERVARPWLDEPAPDARAGAAR